MFERYDVSIDAFPTAQAIALKQINEHKGDNLCIQLVYNGEDGVTRHVHNYIAVNDPEYLEMPEGMDETRESIFNHFTQKPKKICYTMCTTVGDLHFPQGVSSVVLRDCSIGGRVMLQKGVTLSIEWNKRPCQNITVTTEI